jgi:hypothetical protein
LFSAYLLLVFCLSGAQEAQKQASAAISAAILLTVIQAAQGIHLI